MWGAAAFADAPTVLPLEPPHACVSAPSPRFSRSAADALGEPEGQPKRRFALCKSPLNGWRSVSLLPPETLAPSHTGIVLSWLLRQEPFTRLNRELQGGHFDHAERCAGGPEVCRGVFQGV